MCKSLAYLLLYFNYILSCCYVPVIIKSKLLQIALTEIIYVSFFAALIFRKRTDELAQTYYSSPLCGIRFNGSCSTKANLFSQAKQRLFSFVFIPCCKAEIVFIRVSSFALFRGFSISQYSLFCLNGGHFHFFLSCANRRVFFFPFWIL